MRFKNHCSRFKLFTSQTLKFLLDIVTTFIDNSFIDFHKLLTFVNKPIVNYQTSSLSREHQVSTKLNFITYFFPKFLSHFKNKIPDKQPIDNFSQKVGNICNKTSVNNMNKVVNNNNTSGLEKVLKSKISDKNKNYNQTTQLFFKKSIRNFTVILAMLFYLKFSDCKIFKKIRIDKTMRTPKKQIINYPPKENSNFFQICKITRLTDNHIKNKAYITKILTFKSDKIITKQLTIGGAIVKNKCAYGMCLDLRMVLSIIKVGLFQKHFEIVDFPYNLLKMIKFQIFQTYSCCVLRPVFGCCTLQISYFCHDFDGKMKKNERKRVFLGTFPNAGLHKNGGLSPNKTDQDKFSDSNFFTGFIKIFVSKNLLIPFL